MDTGDQHDVENEATRRRTRARFSMAAGAVLMITLGMLLVVSGYIGTPRSYTAMGAGVVILVTGTLALLNAGWTLKGEGNVRRTRPTPRSLAPGKHNPDT